MKTQNTKEFKLQLKRRRNQPLAIYVAFITAVMISFTAIKMLEVL